jgi:hypothetical protein
VDEQIHIEDRDGNPVELFEPARYEPSNAELFIRSLAAISLMGTLAPALSGTAGPTAIDNAVDAVRVDAITTVQLAASGAMFRAGQNFSPRDAWPRIELKRYTAVIDYVHGAIQQDLVREMASRGLGGGGVPFTGELHQIEAS